MMYSPDDYDHFDVLKPPTALAFINLYVLRYALFILLPLVPRIGDKFEWIGSLAHVDIFLLLSVVPAVIFSIAWFKRTPDAKPWHKKVWQQGRALYLGSVSYDMVLLIVYGLLGHRVIDGVLFGFIYLDVMVLVYLLKSKHLKDALKEFPEKDAGQKMPRKRGKYNPRELE